MAAGGVVSAHEREDRPVAVRFEHGVASGDPLADRVILWTHARRGNTPSPVQLRWEVARDAAFDDVVASGRAEARAETGFTAKVDASGLTPGHDYFYRFRAGADVSPVGRTRTLPALGVSEVKLAVFSCANYPAGHFHAYGEALRAGADYAVHLGDYLYEYGAGGYASEDAAALERTVEPAHELITLDDYRRRYAQYRSDPDLKQLHAHLPMIAIWDDHEIANDAFMTGAENHTEGAEGSFAARKAAALQAYHEWLPIRTPDLSDLARAYRSFDFGDLLSLHLLETRLVGREQPIEIGALVNPATRDAAVAALASPTRQMLGEAQMAWLTKGLQTSKATWQVLGQQVLMARMAFPASILMALNSSNTSPEAQAAAQQAITAYLTAKAMRANGMPLSPPQQALLDPSINPLIGYNLDAWDGYPVARERVLGTAAALGKRLVSLAGDTHNAWHSELRLLNGTPVGAEFATPGVSSPGLEAYLSSLPPAQTAAIFQGVIDTLRFADTSRRGFLMMSFTPSEARGTWHLLDSVKSPSYSVDSTHSHALAA